MPDEAGTRSLSGCPFPHDMNRILFEPDEIRDGWATFSDVRAEHVLNVLHGEVGQTLKTGVLNGLVGTSVIERIEGNAVTVRCTHETPSLAPWIDLILAPPRPRAMKRLLPQLASLGVRQIVLVGAEKVEKAFWGAQLLKEEIYRPLLVDGLQQAGTTTVPTIETFKSLRHFVERKLDAHFKGQPTRLVAHPAMAATSAAAPAWHVMWQGRPRPCSKTEAALSHLGNRAATSAVAPQVPVLAVGPEGGWTDEEVGMLEEKGFARMSLGPRILRTDTALIALISRLMEFYDCPQAGEEKR